ncbi:MAG: sugar phosphate isomerase/epimerase family protein [Verrucomicrobiota bacterium]
MRHLLLTLLIVSTLQLQLHATPGFYALDNAFAKKHLNTSEQVSLLKRLGYAGVCTELKTFSQEFEKDLKKAGLGIHATYIILKPKKNLLPVDQEALDHIAYFKGSQTLIWLTIMNGPNMDDAQAVEAINKIADTAKTSNLKVALYPHYKYYTDVMDTCLRLAEKVNRPEVGVVFTLCHFLKQNDHSDLEKTIEIAAPYLMSVQVNGAYKNGKKKKGWSQLILPLGEGDFDVSRVLNKLVKIGYQGEFSLQCFNIKKTPQDHLSASMKAWHKINENKPK